MADKVRMTLQTLAVLRVLLVQPAAENYGLRVAQRCGLPTGSVYPILARLEAADWITSDWENIDESAEGRRRRRLYQLTPGGTDHARAALLETQQKLGSSHPTATGNPSPDLAWGY
ncbi:PadR family transcriptional regulator [Nocardia sp. CA-107356]|uniref:PadR family transcriptional regulator n=1 Tax=Nocardia sp. CA-107356 TaxID=3239972 RepID=UPI003D908642